jgi:transcriptional pleiotropic regulator of transition state genes
MRSIGTRKLDELGRIVLPIDIRRLLNLQDRDSIEIYVSSDGIVLRKYQPTCVFCGETEKVKLVHDKLVCKHCIRDLKSL